MSATVGPANGNTRPQYFTAPSRIDAWSFWKGCLRCNGPHDYFYLERWNGTRWVRIAVPSAASDAVGLGASSARNAWLFTAHSAGDHSVNHALIWNGSWHEIKIPDWVIQLGRAGFYAVQPEVFGPKAVWLFDLTQSSVAEYNGHTWIRRHLPGVPGTISAVSSKDIWATSFGTKEFLMHWNGVSWRTVSIPPPAHVPPDSNEYIGGLAASDNGVWLARDIETGSQGARTLYLLHWNGRAWHRVSFRLPTSFVDQLAQDGQGGLWLAGNGLAPRYRWYFDHLLSTGRWTRQLVRATATTSNPQVLSLTWVPGTRSMWATGTVISTSHGNAGFIGSIFRFSP